MLFIFYFLALYTFSITNPLKLNNIVHNQKPKLF